MVIGSKITLASDKSAEKERRPNLHVATPAPTSEFVEDGELLNREVSLLRFYERVLEQAKDHSHPLLERLKFLSIFSDNLDEFFMVRVSGLKESVDDAADESEAEDFRSQLKVIRNFLSPLITEQALYFGSELRPALAANDVEFCPYDVLSKSERAKLRDYFQKRVLPVLTPQGVDPGHPFPYISALSLNIGVMVGPVSQHGITQSLTGSPEPRFVRIEIPRKLPRLVPVDAAKTRFVLLEEIIAGNVDALFPRMHPGKCHTFRVTRDADVEIRDEEAGDLLRRMQLTLKERRFGLPVRLEVSKSMPNEMINYLLSELNLSHEDVYEVSDPLDLGGLMCLYKIDRPDLKDKPFTPTYPTMFRNKKAIFDSIASQDILLHHPYDDYTAVTDFINAAADDPNVLAIKMCLYRTGKDSPIPPALIKATESGKQVTVIVELKARFDEENNIEWAKRLEKAGVHVIYGIVGLKTHCKLMLVVRSEGDEIKRYVHIATGNYNPVTSGFYTDIGLFTADEEIGEDATDLFNYLTGFSRQKDYSALLVSPVNMRQKMIGLIKREAENARNGRPARIVAKLNRLADPQIISALYKASQAGVKIDLIVRSICMLRPGVPGLSENITVRSIVGRFLEHSRIFSFANDGNEEVFIGSSDWMQRNFDRRVEVVVPVKSPRLRSYLRNEVLEVYLKDNVRAHVLNSDGTYEPVLAGFGESKLNGQVHFFGR